MVCKDTKYFRNGKTAARFFTFSYHLFLLPACSALSCHVSLSSLSGRMEGIVQLQLQLLQLRQCPLPFMPSLFSVT